MYKLDDKFCMCTRLRWNLWLFVCIRMYQVFLRMTREFGQPELIITKRSPDQLLLSMENQNTSPDIYHTWYCTIIQDGYFEVKSSEHFWFEKITLHKQFRTRIGEAFKVSRSYTVHIKFVYTSLHYLIWDIHVWWVCFISDCFGPINISNNT